MSLRCVGLGYRYPGGAEPALRGVDLELRPGLTLLTGPTGCGKSTLLRLAAGLLQRHGSGEVLGRVDVQGEDPATWRPGQRPARVGFVHQSPERSVVTGSLGDELALPLGAAGWPASDIDARAAELLAALGLPPDPRRSPQALSGGQRQRLAVAAALAAGPQLLLLDEPLAHLDPAAADDLVDRLAALGDGGVSVLMVEHRLGACMERCQRLLVLDGGRLVHDGPADEPPLARLRELGLRPPALLDLRERIARRGIDLRTATWELPEPDRPPLSPPALTTGPMSRRYGDTVALHPLELTLQPGERVAVVGPNGAGKSSLLACLVEQREPGVVHVPQDPDLALFCETVREELAYGPRERRRSAAQIDGAVREAAAALSVAELLDRPPQALSRGQRLRVAVAAALACDPRVLLLDEPTSGQDHDQVERLMAALTRRGQTLLFATHDLELACRHATRVLALVDGRVRYEGAPEHLPADLPSLPLPPLVAWCRQRMLPVWTPAELADRAEAW